MAHGSAIQGKVTEERARLGRADRRSCRARTDRRRKALVVVSLFLLAVSVFLALRGPLGRLAESERQLRELEGKLEQERAVTRSLEERLESARDPSYLERKARELGYVKPGEVPLVVEERRR